MDATGPMTDATAALPTLRDVMEACRRLDADDTLPPAIRSCAGELADEITYELGDQ